MEKAKRRVRICLLCVIVLAIVVGILYFYHDLGEPEIQAEGTLVSAMKMGWKQIWHQM